MTGETLDHSALLVHARDLMTNDDSKLTGTWPRAVALLARGSLEELLDDFWLDMEPEMVDASMRAQLLCLTEFTSERTAAKAAYLFGALSDACHYHPYDLPPTAGELSSWMTSIDGLAADLEASRSPLQTRFCQTRVVQSSHMSDLYDHALPLLRQLTGSSDATFRPGQFEAIEAVLTGTQRALVVQRTGWGKSAVYFLATRILRDQGSGPTLIVSPLLALMRNQVEAAHRLGLEARTVNSTNTGDWATVFEEIDADTIDVLLISPERLNNPGFRANILPGIINRMGLLVIDEVHCISDWGHDFRPDYRRLERVVGALPPSTPVLGTTATANDRVIADVVEQLGQDIKIVRGPLDRPSLKLQVIDLPDKAHRMAWLADVIPTLPGSGIIYTLTIADATRTAAFLRSRDIDARSYTGQTDAGQRLEIEELLSVNDLKVVVATSALAMGYDNPFIEFVIHFQIPASAISYYQQVGRAGRAVDSSYGIALAGVEDKRIQDYFIDSAFPTEDVVEAILKALSDHGGLKINELLPHVNIRYKKLEAALNLLEVERAVYKDDAKWYRSAERWDYPRERFEHVTSQRKAEQAAMAQYVTSTDCLMQQLRTLLDDPSEPCGRCANCTGPLLPESAGTQNIARAEAFLTSEKIVIPPKRRSPTGLSGLSLPSTEEGRVLSRYNEPGFGALVKAGKYETERFDDALLEGAVRLIQPWKPTPYPTWVVAVADAQEGGLVEDFARRLAERLDLPFDQTIRRANRVAEQKGMENSYMQAANAMNGFKAIRSHTGPVLLIDDIVDSGWTLAVVADLLRKNEAAEVFPLALATAGNS